jgi:hypothetical protein
VEVTPFRGCRIIIRTLDVARLNVALHETGHFLGLCHSLDPGVAGAATSPGTIVVRCAG